MKTKITYIIILLLTTNFGYGQTILSAGDIAITGFNSDNPDQFTFVLLTDILNTTQIKFTDNGWQSSGSFRSNEGTITWSATSDMTCGTEITVTDNSPFSTSHGTVTDSGALQLSGSGDQILAYQGLDVTPTFIYAIHFDTTGWGNATNPNTTALPTGLTNGVDAVDLVEIDNANYNCAVTSGSSLILSAVSNSTNWILNNSRIASIGGCGFTCIACPTTTTWSAGAWDNGVPIIGINAVIADNYNTSIDGNFSACSIIVNTGFNLTVNNGDYIEVENDVTVDGQLFVETQGNFVQNNNFGSFTDNSTNGVQVTKTKIMTRKFAYTYWSSPYWRNY